MVFALVLHFHAVLYMAMSKLFHFYESKKERKKNTKVSDHGMKAVQISEYWSNVGGWIDTTYECTEQQAQKTPTIQYTWKFNSKKSATDYNLLDVHAQLECRYDYDRNNKCEWTYA